MNDTKNTEFDLNVQYQLYLSRVGLKEDKMHPDQRREIRRAFMGACGQMLILFRDGIGNIESEEEAVNTMQDMINQVGDYWIGIIGGLN